MAVLFTLKIYCAKEESKNVTPSPINVVEVQKNLTVRMS